MFACRQSDAGIEDAHPRPDLDLRGMIASICSRTNLPRGQAYAFCSLAVDFRVTQSVNGKKGVHGMLRRGVLFQEAAVA